MTNMTKGIKTSEFWVAAVTAIVTLANQSGLLGTVVLPLEAIATVAGIVSTYILSRGLSKLNG